MNPKLFQVTLPIDPSNLTKKIKSVTIAKKEGGIPNIFAFTADAYNSCESPSNIKSTSTFNSATVTWDAPEITPQSGYHYYFNTSSLPPTATTVPTSSVPTGHTSVTLENLTTGRTYSFWLRATCADGESFWKMIKITTGQISGTYTLGDISTMYAPWVNNLSSTDCPGQLSITVPPGYQIKSTAVSYKMSTASNGWMDEQRSLLACTTNNNSEPAVSSGSGSSGGTYSYSRSGLSLATGLVGTVDFELRAWRTYGGLERSNSYNKVDDGTFTVTLTLEPTTVLPTVETDVKEKEIIAYPNPFKDILRINKSQKVKMAVLREFSGVIVKIFNNPPSELFLGGAKTGIYILTLYMKDGSAESLKLMKEN